MKHIKFYEYFDVHAWVDKQDQYERDSIRFQEIIDLIKHELGSDVNDIDHISQSRTKYGHSWYIIFDNGKEIRLSDHAVISLNRIQSDNLLARVNIHLDFSEKYAKRIADYYRRVKKAMNDTHVHVDKLFNDPVKKREYIDQHSAKFIDELIETDRTITEIEKSYMDMDTFKNKHPTAEYILQQDIGGFAFSYTFVKAANGESNYIMSKEYFEFLSKIGIFL